VSLGAALDLARAGRLYPSVILYGSTAQDRREAALELGRALLCGAGDGERPCGECRHCRRIVWPEAGATRFHPDFHVLERDLRTATSVDATKGFLASTVSTPFEARGQVFVVGEADTLGPGAGDVLLKTLEEPPSRTPRNFMLLAGSRLDLLATLRSRSLAIYLGGTEALDEELVEDVAQELGRVLDAYFETAPAAASRSTGSGRRAGEDTGVGGPASQEALGHRRRRRPALRQDRGRPLRPRCPATPLRPRTGAPRRLDPAVASHHR